MACVLAPYSSIDHKELILPINEVSITEGDVLTNYFQGQYIYTSGGVDSPRGSGGYRGKVSHHPETLRSFIMTALLATASRDTSLCPEPWRLDWVVC